MCLGDSESVTTGTVSRLRKRLKGAADEPIQARRASEWPNETLRKHSLARRACKMAQPCRFEPADAGSSQTSIIIDALASWEKYLESWPGDALFYHCSTCCCLARIFQSDNGVFPSGSLRLFAAMPRRSTSNQRRELRFRNSRTSLAPSPRSPDLNKKMR